MADDGPDKLARELERLPAEQLLARVVHRLRHVEETVAALRGLVPKAFAEGFQRRAPDQDEPWLADWLTSDAKQELEALVPRRAPERPEPEGES